MNTYLKRSGLTVLFCALMTSASIQAQNIIFKNDINHSDPSQFNPFSIGQITDANISATGIGRGPGLIASSAADVYRITGWDTPAIDLTGYLEFTITPNTGFKINFSSQEFRCNLSGAPSLTPFVVRSSADNYTANIPFSQVNFAAPVIVNLSATAFQNVAAPITFRIYPFGSSGATATFSINEFTFKGTVNQSLNVPEDEVSSFKYYPSPMKDELAFSFEPGIATIILYNLMGQMVSSHEINATEAKIDVSPLKAATYLIKLISKTGAVKIVKIVKI